MDNDYGSGTIASAYGEDMENYSSLFEGNYLNFGYWHGIDINKKLTAADRLTSGMGLYRRTLNELSVQPSDRILEIGCGRGCGTALAWNEFKPAEAHGIDLLHTQIAHAVECNSIAIQSSDDCLIYRQGSATAIPYTSRYFSKVFSVEAIQHISDLSFFADELVRVLRRPGRIALAAAFSPAAGSRIHDLRNLLGPFKPESSSNHPIAKFAQCLNERGITGIRLESIGNNVWYGMDAWANQTEFSKTRIRNWVKAYEQGIVDYYIVSGNLNYPPN